MYLGLDLGTSGLKALLVDENQAIVAEATAPLKVSRPNPSWSEQDPHSWIEAAKAVMSDLKSRTSLDGVRAIGLSGQQHGATLLDRNNEVLRPAILWNDTRAGSEAEALSAVEGLPEAIGSLVFAGFTAPKLVWAAKHEPDIFERTALVLLPKDYLRLWLTGEAVTDMSDASGTGWLDVGERAFSPRLLEAGGMRADQMPRAVEGSAPAAGLRKDVADQFGLRAGIQVAGGGGDNAASAVGMGVVKPGQAFVSLGTSGVLFAPSATFAPKPEAAVHTFCHALPGLWHHMGVILAATDALNWFAELSGTGAAELTADLGPLRAPGRALFLPYLGGERTPINAPDARAAFVGLAHETNRSAATRAVLEGVTFALADCAQALAATGTTLDKVIAVGGGSRSTYWLSAIATALRVPVEVPAAGEYGGAFGAARLAMLADGADPSILTPPDVAAIVEPDPQLVDAFAEGHIRYGAVYAALKDLL